MQPQVEAEISHYIGVGKRLHKSSICMVQLFIYPFLVGLRLLVVRNGLDLDKAISGLRRTSTGETYIIYANHQSKLDPLIICASLPFKTIARLLPFRFFVENSYFRSTTGILLRIMGGFPAHYEPNRPYGLDYARTLITSRQTIVIFPSGQRTRESIVKPGISVLAAETHTRLIPVYINWKSHLRCHVRFGKPIKDANKLSAGQLMNHVNDLALKSNGEIHEDK
jgi:1-acyl-sn-glycerol-3-phosphate acyltransferase